MKHYVQHATGPQVSYIRRLQNEAMVKHVDLPYLINFPERLLLREASEEIDKLRRILGKSK